MFLIILALVLLAATAHVLREGDASRRRVGETFLVYLLVGYCGVPMLVVSGGTVLAPDQAAAVLGFPPGNPFQAFLGWAYLGMSLLAVLALRYRGEFLVGPAVVWAVFFAGATQIHVRDLAASGAPSHGGVLYIVATHGLISVLLVAALLASGAWAKERGTWRTGYENESDRKEPSRASIRSENETP